MRPFARDSLILVASNISAAALGFSLSVVVGRGLGEAGFGRWTFCLAWASVLTMICEFGLNSLLTREASRVPRDANRLLISSLKAKLILVGLLGGSVWLLAPILGLDPETSAALRVVVLIALAGIAYGSFTAVFRSYRWMSPILWLSLIGGLVQLGWSVWIVMSGSGVIALIWAAAVIDLAQLFVAMILWWSRIKPYGGTLKTSLQDVISLTRDAIPFAIAGTLGAIQLRSSVLMLGYLRGEVEVGSFGAASRFSEAAKLVPFGIFDAAYPALASASAGGHSHSFPFKSMRRFLLILTLLLAGILILVSRPVVELAYGPGFLSSADVMILLAIGLVPMFTNGTLETYLYATGDEVFATRLRGVSVVTQVLTGLPLIAMFGAGGAAVAVLLAEVVIWLPLRRRVAQVTRGMLV